MDRTSFCYVGSLVTSLRVTPYTHGSRARFQKKNNMEASCKVVFLIQFKKTKKGFNQSCFNKNVLFRLNVRQ